MTKQRNQESPSRRPVQKTRQEGSPAKSRLWMMLSRDPVLTGIVTAFGIALALLHLEGALSPSGLNWGVHILSFLPWPLGFVIPALMLLALVPAVQDGLIRISSFVVQKATGTPRLVWGILIIAFVAGAVQLFWSGREETFLLGDGRLAMRNLGDIHDVETIPVGFKNAPLPGYVVWKLFLFLKEERIEPAARLAFRFVSMAMGGISVILVLLLVKRLTRDPVEQILSYLLIIAAGGSQLFFGYVEAYAPAYCALLLFAWLAGEYVDDRVHLALPSVAFGVLLVCHFGMVFLAPAMVFLLYHAFVRGKRIACLVSIVSLTATVVSLLWVSGYSLDLIEGVFFSESGTHIIPLAGQDSGWRAYTLLSPWHALDLVNIYALVAPFALVILVLLAASLWGKLKLDSGYGIFFALIAAGGMAFSVLMNFDIGMSRDWDLLAPYILAVVLGSVFVWMRGVESEVPRRRLMAMMAVISLLHTGAYVAVNASEERSLARFETLPDPRLWGGSARAYAYEDLSAYYRDLKEATPASLYTERCLEADSTNSRRWVNASVVFQISGEKAKEIHAYEKAVELGTQIAWVYGNLGNEYIKAGRFDEASAILHRALELDPKLSMAAYNLGSLLGSGKHQYQEALSYLLQAVETDSTFPLAWLNVGTCLYEMGKVEEMVPYYRKFLDLAPSDPAAPGIRQLMASTRSRRGHTTESP